MSNINRSLKRLSEPTELQSHQKDPLEIPSPNLDMWRIINVKKAEGRTTSDVVVKTVYVYIYISVWRAERPPYIYALRRETQRHRESMRRL